MSASDRIITVLKQAKKPLYLWQIQELIQKRWGERHETTAISARIRDEVRHRLRATGFTVANRAPEGKSAHVYWLARV